MGHGPGPAMRAALEQLTALDAGQPEPRWHSVYEVAGAGAPKAQRESIRRALKTLHGHGQVELTFCLGPLGSRGRMGQLHARLASPAPAEPAVVA